MAQYSHLLTLCPFTALVYRDLFQLPLATLTLTRIVLRALPFFLPALAALKSQLE